QSVFPVHLKSLHPFCPHDFHSFGLKKPDPVLTPGSSPLEAGRQVASPYSKSDGCAFDRDKSSPAPDTSPAPVASVASRNYGPPRLRGRDTLHSPRSSRQAYCHLASDVPDTSPPNSEPQPLYYSCQRFSGLLLNY